MFYRRIVYLLWLIVYSLVLYKITYKYAYVTGAKDSYQEGYRAGFLYDGGADGTCFVPGGCGSRGGHK